MKTLVIKAKALLLLMTIALSAQSPRPPFPVRRVESADTWRRGGWDFISRSKEIVERRQRAKNVILFIGDGMGVSTLTAARIFEGQKCWRERRREQAEF